MAVMDINGRIAAAVDQRTRELVALRRELHQHPELAFEEHETAKAVAAFLAKLGIKYRAGIGKTGIIALIDGAKPGPTIGIRADMDALPIHEQTGLPFASKVPGKMHACGHDVHTVIALGVAAALSEMRSDLHGRVKLIFQPAEETLSGAQAMIADGVLDDPKMDVVLGYHNWPAVEAGKVGYNADVVMASADAFDITLKGREGHGAHPHMGIDALAAAAQFVSQVQTIVSREVKPISPAVVTIGELHAGTARNIIAGTATLKGIVRTMEAGLSEKIEQAMRRMLDGIKTGMRVDYTLDWKRVAPALRNHKPTLFFGVPTAYALMLAAMDAGAPADFSSVRACASMERKMTSVCPFACSCSCVTRNRHRRPWPVNGSRVVKGDSFMCFANGASETRCARRARSPVAPRMRVASKRRAEWCSRR